MIKAQDSMQDLRKKTVIGLIRGLQKIKAEAKRKDMPWVDGVVDKLNGYIKAIEFQKAVDENGVLIEHKYFQKEADFISLRFEKGDVTSDGKVAFSKHYSTQYTIEVMKTIRNLQDAVDLGKRSIDQQIEAELRFWDTNVVNIAKPRSSVLNNHYQTDPYFMLKKYTSDVGVFNFKSHLKSNFEEAFRVLSKDHLEPARKAKRQDLEDSTMDMIRLLKDVYKEVDITDPVRDPGFDNMMRAMTSLTYFRLMGGNVRSATRNATQRLYEFTHFGFNAVRQAYSWYRSENVNERREMVNRQKSKFGLMWSDGKSLFGNIWESLKGDTFKLSDQSRGALEDAHRLETNLYINKKGELTVDRSDMVSARIAGYTTNRAQTFRTGFALAYENIRHNSPRSWIARQILGKAKIEKLKELYGKDYEVGYKDLQNLYGEKTRLEMDKWAETKAGQIAYNAVLDLHFEYAKWNKAEIIRASNEEGKAKKMAKTGIGQFAHYRFNMVKMMYGFMRDAKRSIRAGDFFSEEVMRPIRMGMLNSLVLASTLYLREDFMGLFSNDVVDTARAFGTWMQSEREKFTEEGVSEETADLLRRRTYGQGGYYFLGPNVGWMLNLVELYTKSQGIENPLANEVFEGALEETMTEAQIENRELYNKLALFNSQLARSLAYTWPSVTGKGGSLTNIVRMELGLFPSKEQREWSRYLYGTKTKSRKKAIKKSMSRTELQNIMKALGNF